VKVGCQECVKVMPAEMDKLERGFHEALNRAAAGDSNSGDFKITKEEADKFREAFKKKEFRDLFTDYVQEISDPKNREEYEAYLRQAEAQNKVPKGVHLVRPKGGFVVKTFRSVKNQSDKEEKSANKQKIFVNVCSADEVAKPSSSGDKVRKGVSWSLPHFLGPPHMERDKKNVPCTVFEMCFHHDTLYLASQNQRFKQMVCGICIDEVEKQMRKHEKNDNVVLDRKYRVLKGVLAMGGNPKTLSMRKTENNKEEPEKKKEQKKKKNNGKVVEVNQEEIKKLRKSKQGKKEPKSLLEPQYTVTERKNFQLKQNRQAARTSGECLPDADANSKEIPDFLVIRIDLPRIKSITDVQLDVSSSNLKLEVPSIYALNLKLPYQVLEKEQSNAKYDKHSKRLEVTLKVKPLELAKIPFELAEKQELNTKPVEEVQKSKDIVEHKHEKEIMDQKTQEEEERERKEEEERKEKEKKNKAAWDAYCKNADKAREAPPKAPVPSPTESKKTSIVNDGSEFIASSKFEGRVEGMVFKKDTKGLGYYIDRHLEILETETKKKAAEKEVEANLVPPPEGDIVSVLHEFHQGYGEDTATLLIVQAGIDPETVAIHYEKTWISVKYKLLETKQESEFVVHLRCKKGEEKAWVDEKLSSFDVLDENMLINIGKRGKGQWRMPLKITSIGVVSEEIVEDKKSTAKPSTQNLLFELD